MHPTVPVIGFVSGAFGTPSLLDAALSHRTSKPRFDEGRPEAVDYFTAAFVFMAVAFGPAVAWLLGS